MRHHYTYTEAKVTFVAAFKPPKSSTLLFTSDLNTMLRLADRAFLPGDLNAKHVDCGSTVNNQAGINLRIYLHINDDTHVHAPTEPTFFRHFCMATPDTLDIAIT